MRGPRQKIWITRAQPGADLTAERVRALGHEAVIAPLLQVEPLPGVAVDLDGVAALAFTSANGVRVFADRCADRALKVFAVGQSTALAARKAGFRTVLSADGDVAALAEGIRQRAREFKGVVLHPGAEDLAGDLVGTLARDGIEARRLTLYRSSPVPLAGLQAQMLVESDAVLLFSPRAGQALAKVLKAYPAPHLRALGLSKAVLKPLARTTLAARAFPSLPLETGLLNLIDRSS